MTEDVIERYDTFNTKVFPEDLIFGDFNDQPIPSTYSDLTNNYDDDGTQIEAALTDNEVVDSYNEGVDNEFLPPEKKWSCIRNSPNINYSNKRATRISMVRNNIIVGSD